MKFHKLIALIASVLTLALLSGCISVNLSPESFKSATDVNYSDPPAPFKEFTSPGSDRAWKNAKNGNSITYVTECGRVDNLALNQVAKTTLRSQGIVVQAQQDTNFNGHKAVQTKGIFSQEKNPVLVELVTFKADDCLINLAYIAKKESFESDLSAFETFKQNFKGP